MRRGIRLKYLRRRGADADGRPYLYLERPGLPRVALHEVRHLAENDPTFIRAYAAAWDEAAAMLAESRRAAPRQRDLRALVTAWQASPTWHALRASTAANWHRHLCRMLHSPQREGAPVAGLRPRHIRADLRGLGLAAQRTRLTVWRRLLDHAVDIGWAEENPARTIRQPRQRNQPHSPWPREMIRRFRAHWPSGSRQRRAFALALWTGARRGDLCAIGRQHIRAGTLTFETEKQRVTATVPLALGHGPRITAEMREDLADLLAELAAMPPGEMLFLACEDGTPRSVKAAGMWFRKACAAAGIPAGYTLHGLRHTRGDALGDAGWRDAEIMPWLGKLSAADTARYTARADRRAVMLRTAGVEETGS